MDILGVERALEEIGTTLHKIFTLLEQHAPQGSEREQLALRIYTADGIGADVSFEHADEWIRERDKQRVRQAE
jgi:hypothetical protein